MPSRRNPGDAYEANAMSAAGAIIHRDKQVAKLPFWLMLPMALIALLMTVAVAAGAEPNAPRLAALT
jgi:hypothetical protein